MSTNPSFRKNGMDLAAQAAGIGALADPVRRALYEYVAAQPDAVGREAAAAAVQVPVHTAKFHLDRLCDEGLLQPEYRRLSGKTGPGAGRPAKLYRRASREFAVSLPERRYDLAAHILATAVQHAESGTQLADALREAAYGEGRRLGAGTSAAGPDLARLAQALATQGFEPRLEGDVLVLANCPFDSLAREHTSLVCGLNQWYVQGTADGLGCQEVRACLAPAPGMCCIRASLSSPSAAAELRWIMRSSSSAPQSVAAASAAASAAADPPGVQEIAGLGRLRAEIRSRAADPYLLTVTSGCRPHCGTVTVTWDAADDSLAVRPAPRTWAGSAAAGHCQVTLLWPPDGPGGYNLIVDGTGASRLAGDDPAIVVTITRAVLHRRGPAPANSSSACGSDCVPLTG